MLEAMIGAWDALIEADAVLTHDLDDANHDLEQVTQAIQQAYQQQREAEAELMNARHRMTAALAACQSDPFTTLLTNASANQTWWIISSP